MNLSRMLFLAFLFGTSTIANLSFAQSVNKESEKLSEELERLDAEFFDKSFNQCELDYLDQHIDEALVFYHDQSGIQHKQDFLKAVRENICSNPEQKPIRHLTPGSLSVSPLYNQGKLYGAVQSGEHEFYIRAPGKADRLTSVARFTSVWTKKKDDWVLSNVLSYDHQSPSVDKLIVDALKKARVPALGLGVITQGKISKTQVYGELKNGVPAPDNTLFKVASLTKPVVSFVVLRLISEGKLRLDEPLFPYWVDPDVKDDPRHRRLTINHVLTHQTGFKNWRWMNPDNKLAFHFEPGTQHQYSGEGFEYLRIALENKFNTSIESLAEEYLFTPAGMKDTHFWWNDKVEQSRYAVNHNENGEAYPVEKYYVANAAANLITTVEDYTRFLHYLMQQSESMRPVYEAMLTKHVKIEDNDYFGLGWEILTDFPQEEFALIHTGKDPGVNTLAIFFPKSKNAYLIFLNGDNAVPVFESTLRHLYLGDALWQKR
ncbi:class A beta-lactamase-related serine hydrolase [Aliikangiella sp. G2MR2-5]|uniref:class A beta-lactamase-related serine hydrolase n=1 Tax=Aliikangiella sp. G2MR2-5 TaxID=2788943 RepID=UPI001FEE59C7|nr:class A beta-lactamase-related serine hydrolase [Aliikangiella sp. G2MR2-5]